MPLLTFDYNNPCAVCGCRLRGFTVGTYRINNGSLVSARGALTALPGKCPECGTDNGRPMPERWRPHGETQAVIDAARAKRGWVT